MGNLETSRGAKIAIAIALLVILLIGMTLRTWDLDFDDGLMTHPDERSTACFIAPQIGWPTSLDQFGDPNQSPLNPMWNRAQQQPTNYTYGHLPLYLGILTGKLLHTLAPVAGAVGLSPNTVQLMAQADQPCAGVAIGGRLLIALLDTLTILLVFLLGKRSFGAWTGLVAATFYAFTAQAIQLSHFFAMDPASTTFTVMAVLGGVTMVQERKLSAAVWTGIAAGMAVSSKFSALPVLAVPITAVVLWLAMAQRETPEQVARSQMRALGALVIAIVLMGVTFFVTSPYAILDWPRYVKAVLVDQGQMVRGVADFPFTRQYRNTMPYVYFIQQQVEWGLWWPLGILSLAGSLIAALALVWTLIRLASAWVRQRLADLDLSKPEVANVVIWSWVAPYFGVTGAFLAKFNRYMSPVLPFVVLFGAALLWLLWRWGAKQVAAMPSGRVLFGRLAQGASVLVGVLVIAGAAFWSLAYINGVYGHEHTWITASRWIYQNAARGSVLLWEQWDDALPKTVPNEPGMDMASAGLTNIDWGPYEEDTADKFELLKQKLSQADYVVYSSKRIYDSVDELPERYPMTNLYYQAMWDGRLGYQMVADVTSPPRLFGWTFDDRQADESWSLYDHPQVTIFHKVRQLSDAEYDAVFDHIWETAVPYYRGHDSFLSPVLEAMGLGSKPGSEQHGLISALIGVLSGTKNDAQPDTSKPKSELMIDKPLENLAVVDNYRWNGWASGKPIAAVAVWWLVVALLGVVAWPICFVLFAPIMDRGYLFSRAVGWLLAGWLLWILASAGLLYNTVVNSWFTFGILAAVGLFFAWRQRRAMGAFLRERWALLLVEECLFAIALLLFVFIRMLNPDLWQPWFGGEKFMEFAFLNGILRSPTFPPVDPHFAGGYINYYYLGLYLVNYLIKLTGIYAEVAFNLTIPLLFALTVGNAFAISLTAWSLWRNSQVWQKGVMAALLGPFLVALMGNLDGYGQIVRQLSDQSPVHLQSVLPGLTWIVSGVAGFIQVVKGNITLPPYDFWGPSRVIPATINEFPYWSFLFADLHPHLIGIPLAVLYIGALFSLIVQYGEIGSKITGRGVALGVAIAFLLGTIISNNLWDLPTYFGLAILALLVCEYRYLGRIRVMRVAIASVVLLAVALVLYLPFFTHFVNVGASGLGIVHDGDDLGLWLLLWGGLGFIVVSWLLWSAYKAGIARQNWVKEAEVPLESAFVSAEDEVVESPVETARVESLEAKGIASKLEPAEATQVEMADEPPSVIKPVEDTSGIGEPVTSERTKGVDDRGGIARLLGMSMRHFERLPRLFYLHQRLVQTPTLSYLLGVAAIPTLVVAGIVAWIFGRSVLGLCLMILAMGLPLLWRREKEIDGADHLATLLTITGLGILAGTQIFYLKDFLQGGDWYRMNTLFKFFNQVWVLWALAGAIALPRLWSAAWSGAKAMVRASQRVSQGEAVGTEIVGGAAGGWRAIADTPIDTQPRQWWGMLWRIACVLVLIACSFYLVFGTPARVKQRFNGWVPPVGTLDGMAFMQHGVYTWPNDSNQIDLSYDSQAIHWLLDHVRGNLVVAEGPEVDYYRAGGTRVASLTGLSGLRGPHVSEQRYADQVGERDSLHREFWSTPSEDRTEELIKQLDIGLIYAGQLERNESPDGVQKLEKMASEGKLDVLYKNDGVVIYAVPGHLTLAQGGWYVPVPEPDRNGVPDMGTQPLTPVSNASRS
jgi:uncharacterized membrane protein